MRRWRAGGCAALAVMSAGWAGQAPYPLDSQRPFGTTNLPITSYWHSPVSGALLDPARWTIPINTSFPQVSRYWKLIVRELGGPYQITHSGQIELWSMRIDPAGAAFVMNGGAVIFQDGLELRHGSVYLRPGIYDGGALHARRLDIGGRLVFEGMWEVSQRTPSYQYLPVEEFSITGEMVVRGPDGSSYPYIALETLADVMNDGRLVVSGIEPDESVTMLNEMRVVNRGELIMEPGFGSGLRRLTGLSANEGVITITSEEAVIETLDDELTNTGTIDVRAGASLELFAGTIRHESGAIVAAGELSIDATEFHWGGGAIEGEVAVASGEVTLSGAGHSGALTLLSGGTLSGDIPADATLNIGSMDGASPADVTWSGGVNAGTIRTGGHAQSRVRWTGVTVNDGLIDLRGGWALGDLRGSGTIRMGTFALAGVHGGENEFDGRIEIGPHARAQVNGETTLRGALRVSPSVVAILPNYQNQVNFIAPLTIDGATLEIAPPPGFNPTLGAVYNLIGAPSVIGDFVEVIAEPLSNPELTWAIERDGPRYRGRIVSVADVNTDGAVDFADLIAVIGAMGERGGRCDVDGDGVVGYGDVAAIMNRYGQQTH